MDTTFFNNSGYAADVVDDSAPLKDAKWQTLNFDHPFQLVSFYDKDIADGHVTLYKWQLDVNKELADAKPTSQKPCKYCLLANNGSGKDKFVIAPFVVWFALTKIRSRCIITTSSGNQLTSQTEPYIVDLCKKVNEFHGVEIFRIRQRFIKCLLSGSEIRLFATDESGKAEGYHPIDALSEMAIVVNEGKSVTEDIHRALRRCTGYNYWLEVSSAGEPKGYLYMAFTKAALNFRTKRVTTYECPHISKDEITSDIILDGEQSAWFRSKHLSLFTSIGGQSIIPLELVNELMAHPPTFTYKDWPIRVGIDLAAGGDETVVCLTQGNKCIKEYAFREIDTNITANRIADFLKDNLIPKTHPYIYADDGGVGRGIIFNLLHKGWAINKIMNQWSALGDKKQFGNRGAENWYRVKRIIEERYFDLTGLSDKTREQLYNRNIKQSLTGGKMYLEDKKEARAHGRPSPDRADAFILSLTGLTVADFSSAPQVEKVVDKAKLIPAINFKEHFEQNMQFVAYDAKHYAPKKSNTFTMPRSKQRVNCSLRRALSFK